MHATIDRKQLSAALAALKPAIDRRASLPVLQYVLVGYAAGELSLEATDLELYTARTLPAQGDPDETFSVCLKFKALESAVKGRAELVTLTVNGNTASLTAGPMTTGIPTLDAEEYPPCPKAPADSVHTLIVDVSTFVDTFTRIAGATTTDYARPVLTGVHVRLDEGGTLTLEAADGFRLLQTCYTPIEHSERFEALIPAVRFSKLLGKLTSTTARLTIYTERNYLILIGDTAGERIATQLIDGHFPDLSMVIPVKPPHKVAFFAQTALDALAPLKASMGSLRMSYTEGALNLAIVNEDHNITTQLPCLLKSDAWLELIGFNPDYLRSVVQACAVKGEPVQVVLETTTETFAAKITRPQRDPHFVAVLMPMQVY